MAVMPEALYGAGLRFAWEVSHTISLVAGARSAFNIGFLELAAPAFGLGKASAFDATLAVCAGTEPEPAVRLKVCVGPEVSLWKLASLDFDLSREARLTGLGAQASLELSYRLGGAFTLVAFLTARVNTLAGKFTYDDQLVAHQIPRLSLLAGAGPSYAF